MRGRAHPLAWSTPTGETLPEASHEQGAITPQGDKKEQELPQQLGLTKPWHRCKRLIGACNPPCTCQSLETLLPAVDLPVETQGTLLSPPSVHKESGTWLRTHCAHTSSTVSRARVSQSLQPAPRSATAGAPLHLPLGNKGTHPASSGALPLSSPRLPGDQPQTSPRPP